MFSLSSVITKMGRVRTVEQLKAHAAAERHRRLRLMQANPEFKEKERLRAKVCFKIMLFRNLKIQTRNIQVK